MFNQFSCLGANDATRGTLVLVAVDLEVLLHDVLGPELLMADWAGEHQLPSRCFPRAWQDLHV